jgi:TetR/AcrR family tetracycline transcriptional repressor
VVRICRNWVRSFSPSSTQPTYPSGRNPAGRASGQIRRARKVQQHRACSVQELVDTLGAVAMRALASELGVRAPTLYWHVKSKRDIFRAMAVAMSEDAAALTTTLDPNASWQERLRGWAHALRRSILSHRDGARVVAGTFATDPATFHVTEAALQAWQDAGLPRAESARRTVLLRHFVVGFCIEEQLLTELREALLHELEVAADPARFPLTSEAWPAILNTSAEERFELGLRLMLGGL